MYTIDKDYVLANPSIQKIDTDGDVELYTVSITSDNSISDKKEANCRGIVFNSDQIVCNGYSDVAEYTRSDWKDVDPSLLEGDLTVIKSVEGTLLRVFYADKWYISTHRKLNAYKSKWGSRVSFGIQFEEALEKSLGLTTYALLETSTEQELVTSYSKDYINALANSSGFFEAWTKTLDPSVQYVFVLGSNKDSRIVSVVNDLSNLIHYYSIKKVETVGKSEFVLLTGVESPFIGVSQTRVIYKSDGGMSAKNLLDHLPMLDPYEYQGYLLLFPSHKIKLYEDEYKYLADLRGNEQSLKFRYLQLRLDRNKRRDFVQLYADKKEEFNEYENHIVEISQLLKDMYFRKYIFKEPNFRVPIAHHIVLKKLHEWYLEDKRRRMKLWIIQDILNQQKPITLNFFIKELKEEKRRQKREKMVKEIIEPANDEPSRVAPPSTDIIPEDDNQAYEELPTVDTAPEETARIVDITQPTRLWSSLLK